MIALAVPLACGGNNSSDLFASGGSSGANGDASAGSAGTSTGGTGTGGTSTGGTSTGGTSTGGTSTGGTSTGGTGTGGTSTGGTGTGGAGGTGTGGAGGTGAGGTGTGGAGGTGTGGAGGVGGAGGTGGTGTTINCGTSTCSGPSQVCCVARNAGTVQPQYSCIDATGQCTCTGTYCSHTTVSCDGPADCPSGEVCCGTFQNGAYSDLSCASSCTGPTHIEMCQPNDGISCQNGTCHPSNALPGYYYCG